MKTVLSFRSDSASKANAASLARKSNGVSCGAARLFRVGVVAGRPKSDRMSSRPAGKPTVRWCLGPNPNLSVRRLVALSVDHRFRRTAARIACDNGNTGRPSLRSETDTEDYRQMFTRPSVRVQLTLEALEPRDLPSAVTLAPDVWSPTTGANETDRSTSAIVRTAETDGASSSSDSRGPNRAAAATSAARPTATGDSGAASGSRTPLLSGIGGPYRRTTPEKPRRRTRALLRNLPVRRTPLEPMTAGRPNPPPRRRPNPPPPLRRRRKGTMPGKPRDPTRRPLPTTPGVGKRRSPRRRRRLPLPQSPSPRAAPSDRVRHGPSRPAQPVDGRRPRRSLGFVFTSDGRCYSAATNPPIAQGDPDDTPGAVSAPKPRPTAPEPPFPSVRRTVASRLERPEPAPSGASNGRIPVRSRSTPTRPRAVRRRRTGPAFPASGRRQETEVRAPGPGRHGRRPDDGPVPRSANPAPERREGAAPAEAGLLIEAMHFDSATLEGSVRDFFARLNKVGAILGESPTSVSLYYWLLSAAAAAPPRPAPRGRWFVAEGSRGAMRPPLRTSAIRFFRGRPRRTATP